ncbi:iron-sulfur cluster biosynthesis family protein [Paenibacillus sp. HB172176]|uniref:iron-sulfur cluster biosynthesis family protein n=1 Tax=Paenibacillus sp. HB172176 TaxID=2493690 RepID=UPI001F0D5A30|nr:iron-sulfur cluster biosynthesis family protein [Paenibacillus sp. HB172176]
MIIIHITFSPTAVRKLAPILEQTGSRLKLFYDTEGCGCGMSGVPVLQATRQLAPKDKQGEGDPFPFLYEAWYAVFYDDELSIDFDETSGSFSLKSASQIYTKHLRFMEENV